MLNRKSPAPSEPGAIAADEAVRRGGWAAFGRKLAGQRQRHPLAWFIISRVATMLTMLFFIGLGIFALMSLTPGDIVDNYTRSMMLSTGKFHSDDNSLNNEQIKAFKHQLGLDKPFYEQYLHWLRQVLVEHDLGRSLISKAPVLFLVSTRMVNSLILSLISLLMVTIASFILGIWLSSKAGTKLDVAAGFVSMFLNAFPGILLLILLQIFAASTGWFPVTAYPTENFAGNPVGFGFSYLYHILLPLVGAFLGGIGGSLRLIRATMLDQLGQPYISALRSRGIGEGRIRFNHAFRNTMNPFITNSSTLLADLFSGSLILEIIFSYPGIGRLMYEAILQKDIYLVMTSLMFISSLILVGMILADIALALVDPRIRYANS